MALTRADAKWAVIFTSVAAANRSGYEEADARLVELVQAQPGYCGVESLGDAERSITISYWIDLESIRAWKELPIHRAAQAEGRRRWYSSYRIEVCRIERAYGFP
jgi:heme-degrading monooxygenase HmoA